MLEIEYRIPLLLVLVVSRRSVDEAVTHSLVGLRPVMNLTDIAMRNILQGIEILVMGRDLDSAAPTACTIIIKAARIRNRCSVHLELIIMESLVLRSRVACPHSVLIPLHRVFNASDVKLHGHRIWSLELCADDTLRIDHRILFSRLVCCRWSEILLYSL